jgi:hypothetical protein
MPRRQARPYRALLQPPGNSTGSPNNRERLLLRQVGDQICVSALDETVEEAVLGRRDDRSDMVGDEPSAERRRHRRGTLSVSGAKVFE